MWHEKAGEFEWPVVVAVVQVRSSTWRGVAAWLLSGESIELVVTVIGAHIAAVRTPGEALNPLWQPPWPACSPEEAIRKPEVYGEPPVARLFGVIVGHNLCIDRFGGPWPGENKPTHGEAGVTAWTLEQSDPASVVLRTHLEEANLDLTRTFSLHGEVAEVTTTVEHAAGASAEIEWAEHVSIGDPFLENARITAGIDASWISAADPIETWRFSGVAATDAVDPAEALAMPAPTDPAVWGDVLTARVTEGWFRVDRADLDRRLEYSWTADDFPWLCIWTQHRSNTEMPWGGATRAKGLEFSTKPFPEGKPPADRSTTFHGRPTTCVIRPDEALTRTFSIRWSSSLVGSIR